MVKLITAELKEHAPFTAFGAITGIILIFVLRGLPRHISHDLFYVFHPAHVLLSALATAGMYKRHSCPKGSQGCNLLILLFVGYVGSIGIATLSDSFMPYVGEILLDMPHRQAHIGFLEKGWLISTLAVLGIIIAYFNPATKFPHSAHVLISTWASIFHMLMAMNKTSDFLLYVGMFLFLFLAVWVPCCVSDIVFPLLFVKKK